MEDKIAELKGLLSQVAEKIDRIEREQTKSKAIAVAKDAMQQRTTMFCWNFDSRHNAWMLKAVNRLKTNTCLGRFKNLTKDEEAMVRMISEDIESLVRERILHHGGVVSQKMSGGNQDG